MITPNSIGWKGLLIFKMPGPKWPGNSVYGLGDYIRPSIRFFLIIIIRPNRLKIKSFEGY
jgi:hypothetical protein